MPIILRDRSLGNFNPRKQEMAITVSTHSVGLLYPHLQVCLVITIKIHITETILMATESHSFIKKILGEEFYWTIKRIPPKILLIYTCIVVATLILSCFVHWGFISSTLSLLTGLSIFFVAYVLCCIVFFDKPVEVELGHDFGFKYVLPKEMPKSYNKTKVYGIVMIILGVAAILISHFYRKDYAFECETFLVDENKGIYHLDGYNDDCSEIDDDANLIRMQGYEIEELNCSFCPSCEEWAEYAEGEFGVDRYFRK